MRRNKSKESIYSKLKSNYTRPSSRILSPIMTSKSFNSIISSPRSLQKERFRIPSMNFIRIGSPCTTIVHVPRHIAVLKESARNDLTKYNQKLDSLIDKPATNLFKLKPRAVDPKLIDAINSIEMPVKSFDNTLRSTRFFNLGASEENSASIRSYTLSRAEDMSSKDSIPRNFSLRETFYSTVSTIETSDNKFEADLSKFTPYGLKFAHKFIRAVKFGDTASVVKMINSNPRIIETVDTLRQTSLHWAVKRNDLEIAKILLKRGVDINGIDLAGRTALHIAARNDNPLLAKLLIDNGADVNIKSSNGKKAIELAPVESSTSSLLSRVYK